MLGHISNQDKEYIERVGRDTFLNEIRSASFKIEKVSVRHPKTLKIGQWFVYDGWGWIIMTERGVVVNDTKAEMQDEIRKLQRV